MNLGLVVTSNSFMTFLLCCLITTRSEMTKVDLSAVEVDRAGGADQDRGVRRPRRYITPGDSRTSERFRTQPITSAERLESDRCAKLFI